MRRIKLVVSDFHFGTGRRNPDGSLNLMEDVTSDDFFVEFIERYYTGNYTNTEVELIINGDFFNMIQVEIDGLVTSEITEEVACIQMLKILDGHPMVFDVLQAFVNTPNKTLTFIVGNHDAGLIFSAVKDILKKRISKKINIINRHYQFDGVHVEHGDKYEPVHLVDPRLPYLSKGLNKPILNIPWATYFFIHFVRKLKHKRSYIDKVKPFRNYLTWAALYDFRFWLYTIIKLFLFVLNTMFFAKVGNKRYGLKVAYILVRQMEGYPLMNAAQRILKQPKINTVIMGHTHHPLYRQWKVGKEYLNTGCWNGVTNLDIERFGYAMRPTYALLEWNGERWLSNLRVWKGSAKVWEEFLG